MAKITGDLFMEGDEFPFVDSSPNNYTFINTGVSRDIVNKQFGASSMYFDGAASMDMLVTDRFNLVSGEAWTFDCWIRPEATDGYKWIMQAGDGASRWQVHFRTGTLDLRRGTGATTSSAIVTCPASEVTLNVWNHIAITKTAADLYTLYVNGVAKDSATWVGDKIVTGEVRIGRYADNSYYWQGNIDNLRVTRGQILWTENFSLDETSLHYGDPVPASSFYNLSSIKGNLRGKALAGFIRPTIAEFFTSTDFEEIVKVVGGVGAPFLDNASYSGTVTLHGSATNEADSPFTNGTISRSYGNGIYDIITDNSGYDTIGTGDYTIEYFCKTSENAGNNIVIQKGDLNAYNTTSWFQIFQNESGVALYTTDSAGSQTFTFTYRGGILPMGSWFHVAIVRLAGEINLYINGTVAGSPVANTQNISGGSDDLFIGGGSPSYPWVGQIGLVKISKSAEYITNFTPSNNILDYASDANTLVLFTETVS